MEKVAIALLLFSVLMIVPMTTRGHEDPKEVEEWFLKVRHHNEKVTRLHFYFHDIPHGNKPTSAIVAQANMTYSSPTFFGMFCMMDYPLTIEPSLNSKLVGRAQGFYASASMHESDLIMAMNIIFPDGEYNGSSIAVLGHNPIRHASREMAIVGGSGIFRLARGIVILKTQMYDLASGNATIGVDVVAVHHKQLEQ